MNAHNAAVARLYAPTSREFAAMLPGASTGLADGMAALADDPSAARATMVKMQLDGAMVLCTKLHQALLREIPEVSADGIQA